MRREHLEELSLCLIHARHASRYLDRSDWHTHLDDRHAQLGVDKFR